MVHRKRRWAQVALDAGWACGKEVDDDVRLDVAGMRQSIAWELALRNVKRLEASEAEVLLRRETQCEAVRDVKVRPAVRARRVGCARFIQASQPGGKGVHSGMIRWCYWLVIALRQPFAVLCCSQPCWAVQLKCGYGSGQTCIACGCCWSWCGQRKAAE